jgi:hypothetical protein
MKMFLTISTCLLTSLTLVPIARGQNTCACEAPDATCHVSVSCRDHGCTSICGTNNGCYAKCGRDLIKTRFTLKMVKKGSRAIAMALSQRTGHKIRFVPRMPNDLFTIDIKVDDLLSSMDYLEERGELYVDGVPWKKYQEIRGGIVNGKKLSVNFNDISVEDALAHLHFLSGLSFNVNSRDAKRTFSLSLNQVTLTEVLSSISAQSGVKIEQN